MLTPASRHLTCFNTALAAQLAARHSVNFEKVATSEMAENASKSEDRAEPRFLSWLLTNPVTLLLAGFIALLTLFYVEEDLRGKIAWQRCRRQLQANGEVLDWNAFIPPQIPDSENVFAAPKMRDWFVKGGSEDLTSRMGLSPLSKYLKEHAPTALAEGIVVRPDSTNALPEADIILRFNFPLLSLVSPASTETTISKDDPDHIKPRVSSDTDASERLGELVRHALGTNDAPYVNGSQGFKLFARSPTVKPFRILLLSHQTPSPAESKQFFSSRALRALLSPADQLSLESNGTNSFRLLLTLHDTAAADYLAWSDQFAPDFDHIREALKRPSIRIDGNYNRPASIPIYNFVVTRTITQTIGQRAQSYLLLGDSENALRELALLHEMNRLLENKPITLMSAMVETAVSGVYLSVVADGFRLGVWREPQLAALQQQLKEINLPPLLRSAFLTERASLCSILENQSAAAIHRSLYSAPIPQSLWQRFQDPKTLLLPLAPRGWSQQNMILVAKIDQDYLDSFDPDRQIFFPRKLDAVLSAMGTTFRRVNPQNFLAAMTLPHFNKACQTLAHNQALANEALLACALERYRLAHGDLPENLDSLVPAFIQKVPPDLVNGGPLHYHRKDPNHFLLYSVGWNETDDHGVAIRDEHGYPTLNQGDWVWDPLEDGK